MKLNEDYFDEEEYELSDSEQAELDELEANGYKGGYYGYVNLLLNKDRNQNGPLRKPKEVNPDIYAQHGMGRNRFNSEGY